MPSSEQLSLICPACSTRLRLGPDGIPESEFACPDCSARLFLEKTGPAEFQVRAPDIEEQATSRPVLSRSQKTALAITGVAALLVVAIVLAGGSAESPDSEGLAFREVQVGPSTVVDVHDEELRAQAAPDLVNPPEPPGETGVAAAEDADPLLPELDIDDPALRIPTDASEAPQPVVEADITEDSPLLPEFGSDAVALPSFATRTGIAIPSFDQSKPTTLASVIEIVEQLALVSIDTTSIPPDLLSKDISFVVADTTPLGILREAGGRAGVRVVVDEEAEKIRLVPDGT